MPTDPFSFQRRMPRQARAKATVAAILEAAVQILDQRGADALTTNSVAERAGVSIGTLYQYFPDKHAILLAAAKLEFDDASPRRRALLEALMNLIEGLGVRPASGRATRMTKSANGGASRRRVSELVQHILEVLAPLPPQPAQIRVRSRR